MENNYDRQKDFLQRQTNDPGVLSQNFPLVQMVEFSEHSSTSKEKKFKLIKYFKIYSNLSSPFATSYSVQNAVFNNLPEALTSAKAALFDNGVGGGGFPPYHRLLGIYTEVIRMFSWTNLHPSPLVYSWA